MNAKNFMYEMTSLIMDVNPAEIEAHLDDDSLKSWCESWQVAANMTLVQAPLNFAGNKPAVMCVECEFYKEYTLFGRTMSICERNYEGFWV